MWTESRSRRVLGAIRRLNSRTTGTPPCLVSEPTAPKFQGDAQDPATPRARRNPGAEAVPREAGGRPVLRARPTSRGRGARPHFVGSRDCYFQLNYSRERRIAGGSGTTPRGPLYRGDDRLERAAAQRGRQGLRGTQARAHLQDLPQEGRAVPPRSPWTGLRGGLPPWEPCTPALGSEARHEAALAIGDGSSSRVEVARPDESGDDSDSSESPPGPCPSTISTRDKRRPAPRDGKGRQVPRERDGRRLAWTRPVIGTLRQAVGHRWRQENFDAERLPDGFYRAAPRAPEMNAGDGCWTTSLSCTAGAPAPRTPARHLAEQPSELLPACKLITLSRHRGAGLTRSTDASSITEQTQDQHAGSFPCSSRPSADASLTGAASPSLCEGQSPTGGNCCPAGDEELLLLHRPRRRPVFDRAVERSRAGSRRASGLDASG
ncbi:hypothetical protein Q5P01_000519 [Channa striata]|uniref:Uncharacterized protein n=1 Tax=Channa striata TaxID=64152 RepID=A0AA88LN03_CHASR|nr:hypothetical protein Q5P01_000519 [Channa striata]